MKETADEIQQAIIRNMTVEARVWAQNLMSSPTLNVPDDDIFATVQSVRHAITTFGTGAVNLQTIDLHAAHPLHLIAVLRASYPWKSQVQGWSEALIIAQSVLKKHKLNPCHELAGLDL